MRRSCSAGRRGVVAPHGYRILRTDRGYRIAGTPPEDEEELAAALRAAGVRRGAEVEVGGEVLEFQ